MCPEQQSSILAQRVLFEMRLEETANRVPLVFSVGFFAARIGVNARELVPALNRLEQEGSIIRDATGKYGLALPAEAADSGPSPVVRPDPDGRAT